MSPKGKMFTALAVAALAVPAFASAQQGYGQTQDPRSYGEPQGGYTQPGPGAQGYGQSQGDYGQPTQGDQMRGDAKHGHKGRKSVYPQFRQMEKHIKSTVREARKSNTIASRDAHGLMNQLHQIQAEEMSMYQAHGMNLPPDAQARIEGELSQLAQAVDQGQGQQRSGQPYRGQQ
jgi:hypothetical protein